MINIQTITDAYNYVFGSWTSQTLTNSVAGFPTGTTTEWGYLAWEESNTGTGYTGYVRIDILDSTTGEVLLGDLTQNTDGTPTDISSLGTSDIKILVKLYGLDYPTPIVSNIRIKHKNWNSEQVITNAAKNVLLNRALETTTTNPVYDFIIGNGQTTALTESSTGLTNNVSSAYEINGNVTVSSSILHNEDENLIEVSFVINNSDVIIPNGTTINSIGFRNNDTTPIFIGGTRHTDIEKDPAFYYYYKITFKIYRYDNDVYMLTKPGINVLLDRLFYSSVTYSGISEGSTGYQTTALSEDMTALDLTYFGPTVFQYSTLDTSKYKLTLSILMNTGDGNGYNYNAIGIHNTDGSPILAYVALLDEYVQKTVNYIYQFNVNNNMITPIITLL